MKNLIDSLGISHRRFAEEFGIPYRTVAAWYNGERTAPEWVRSLIMQIIELKKNGIQTSINLMQPKYVYCWIQPNHEIPLRLRRFTNEEDYKTDKDDPFWDKRYKEESQIEDVEIYRYTLTNETKIK